MLRDRRLTTGYRLGADQCPRAPEPSAQGDSGQVGAGPDGLPEPGAVTADGRARERGGSGAGAGAASGEHSRCGSLASPAAGLWLVPCASADSAGLRAGPDVHVAVPGGPPLTQGSRPPAQRAPAGTQRRRSRSVAAANCASRHPGHRVGSLGVRAEAPQVAASPRGLGTRAAARASRRAGTADGRTGPCSLPAMDPDPQAGVQVGMRVVRGMDWKWGQQDGGEGGVGTVVELGRHGSPSTPDRTVVVQWDQGTRTNYRAGYQGAHDLLLYDNAQIGVRHPNIICDCCKKHGLRGMRWKCRVCFDYDLCTQCYMHNKHDLTHAFERYETAHSRPVVLSPRQGLQRTPLRGIFQGAKVVRGPDWEWGSQDGGEGKPGRVVDIRGWDVETGRSVASVTWADGTTNVYRVGHKGKVDLKCVGEAAGGFYYKEHLPRLGKPAELQRRVSADGQPFQRGDKVKCLLDTDILRDMQEGHGGWNPRMAEALGRVGKVVKVFGDGNLRVAVGGQWWTFSPSCLVAYRPEEDANLDVAERARENKSSLSMALDKLRAQKTDPEHPGRLVVEAALGNVARAVDLLRRHPEQVDSRNQGRTALQVATYLGQVELVRRLLQARAGVDLPDEEGNTALHYAALGNQPEAARVLLSAGCGADALNGTRSTALHVAVQRGFLEVVRVLCERGCDVNLPDAHADTPLHSAISAGTGASGIVEVLTEVPGVNITATNSQGFTLLHHAALKGHALAVRKILVRARQLVDAKKEDGFTALHLAALNNHREVAQILIQEGRCDVNARNRKLQSPLHLAVQQGHVGLVPLLVDAGCSVNTEDEEGDTALHVALQRHQLLPLVADRAGGDPGPLQLLSRLQALGLPGGTELTVGVAVACFLALEGADVTYANHRGRSPLDLTTEARVLKALQGCAQRFRERQVGGGGGLAPGPRLTRSTPNTVTNLHVAAPGPEAAECLVCSELAPLVLFSPCQHRTVCEECARRMKKCIRCQVAISKKLRPDGSEVAGAAPAPGPPRQLVEELQSRYRQMEERITCPICIDSHIRLVFQCGHGACAPCGAALSACPICRQPIRDRIQIFV
ncbi:PREDICTED: E3 ubiquitin-protein ligase MIB2 isoform X4 [Chinchilla lanigera]|uniref:E3 ubiquitin-protein ligase MIB2 isoform X4 n=1 Tax=Chinchilla lanigera TaxID=34839 RepID=UPI0006977088|nr:PREDICTED: E3 ubiquitin-protein ligase MIB2 isoform X4 [Chinchilla lanigera]